PRATERRRRPGPGRDRRRRAVAGDRGCAPDLRGGRDHHLDPPGRPLALAGERCRQRRPRALCGTDHARGRRLGARVGGVAAMSPAPAFPEPGRVITGKTRRCRCRAKAGTPRTHQQVTVCYKDIWLIWLAATEPCGREPTYPSNSLLLTLASRTSAR